MRINTIRLRLILGVLAILLPIIVSVLALVFGFLGTRLIPDSISSTYYFDPCITPFMIILGAASILLISYQGYDSLDDIICTLAGIFGFCICLFPCYANNVELVGTFQLPVIISNWLHCISAIVFFILLAYNSFFLFTKSSGEMTRNKRIRNIIYRVCGIGMVASFILLIPGNIYSIYGMTWIVELIALFLFGISWLTKCDIFPFLFCDTAYKD